MEIVNTIEFAYKPAPDTDGSLKIDDQFCIERIDAYKKLFTDLDCLGWYSAILGGG